MKLVYNTGITLITLSVTIMILIILSGVTIHFINNDNSVLKTALTARDDTKVYEEKQLLLEAVIKAMANNIQGKVQKEQLEKELDSILGDGKTEVTTVGSKFSVEFTKSKRIYELNEDGEIISNNFENSVPVVDNIFKDVMGAEDIVIENKTTQDTSLFNVTSNGEIGKFTDEDYNKLNEEQKKQLQNLVIGENITATTIAEDAFKGLSFIETLYVSNDNLNIDISAFDSTSIKEIVIQANRVESKSFYNLYNLQSLTLKVNTIGDSAFENGKGKTLLVRANIIGNRAFYNNSGLKEADVKANAIGNELFSNCNALTHVSIATNSLGANTFVQNSQLDTANITIYNDKLKTNSFLNCGVKNVVLNVKGIESQTFNNCYNLTNIIINSTLTKDDVASDFIIRPRDDLKIKYNGIEYSYTQFLQVLN